MRPRRIVVLAIAVAALSVAFASSIQAFAVPPGWVVTQVTPGPEANNTPQVSGSRIAWYRSDGTYGQIVTWKVGDSSPTTVTRDPHSHQNMDLSGDRIAWISTNTTQQIFTWKVGDSSITTLTRAAHDQFGPQVSGDRVVWYGLVDGSGHSQIFTWKVGDSSPTTLTTGSVRNRDPQISGDRVAWWANVGSYQQIFTWKVGDSLPTTVTDVPYSNQGPRVSGDRLVWYGATSGGWPQIFTWKAGDSSVTTLTTPLQNSRYPEISGDRIVWEGMDGNWRVVTWKVGDSSPTTLTPGPNGYGEGPQVSGDRVVWWGRGGGYNQVFTWKVGESSFTTLTAELYDSSNPQVSGDRVVWHGRLEGVWQVFTAAPGTSVNTTEVAGTNRYDTSIKTSQAAFADGSCDTVVVATGANYPDALGAAGLAGAADCPVLLVSGSAPGAAVTTEIARLTQGHVSKRIYVVGGTGAVSAAMEIALKGLYGSPSVKRLAGANRYTTAEAVANELHAILVAKALPLPTKAFVVSGADFPDALLVGPVAYKNHWPILLVGSMDTAFKNTMKNNGVKTAYIVGSTASVGTAVQNALKTALGTANVIRPCAATNRYAQCVAVANWATSSQGFSWDGFGLATGANFPDALGAAPLLGPRNGVLLLTPFSNTLNPGVKSALTAHKVDIHGVYFFGGTGAVSQTVRNQVVAALQ